MYKLVVLLSVLAAAVAKPGLAPLAYGAYYTPTTYAAGLPYLATGYSSYSTPYLYGSPLPAAPLTYTAPAHFIKKRSASLALPSTYIAPTYSAPLTYSYPSTYHAATYTSYPSYVPSPYAYPTHYIKKRSAPLALSTYVAPAAVSHQSRLDVVHSPASVITSYASPYLYSNPLAYSHYFK